MKKETYHAHPAVSSTMLKSLKADRVVFHDTYITKTRPPFVETKPMEIGSIVHSVVLDDRPLRSVVCPYPDHIPELDVLKGLTGPKRDALDYPVQVKLAEICDVSVDLFRAAKGGKALKAITDKAPKNVINSEGRKSATAAAEFELTQPDYDYYLKRHGEMDSSKTPSFERVQQVISALRNSKYSGILESEHVIKEEPIFWTDDDTGMDSRCCPDFLLIDEEKRHAHVWDLKITEFATEFEKQMNQLNYHLQQEHYLSGVCSKYGSKFDTWTYTFLAVKPSYPFHVTEWQFHVNDHEKIANDYFDIMNLLKELKESGDWTHPRTKQINEARLWDRTII